MRVVLSSLLLRTFLLLLFCSASVQAAGNSAYYSDYFSFIGQDDKGYLLFALDNRREVDKYIFQAEHFGVIYDQRQDWIDLVGSGEYQNPSGILTRIPNSTAFKFSGRPATGVTILSRVNDLRLEINPLVTRMAENPGELRQHWGNAAAVLYWQGRTIPGRVIYRGLIHHNGNRQIHKESIGGKNHQDFYLAIQDSSPAAWQDLYLHSEGKNKNLKTKGFLARDRGQLSIFSPDLWTTKKSWALGFYRWGKGWQMSLQTPATDQGLEPPFATLKLKQLSRENISNWVIGGFAMSVVTGTFEQDGQKLRVLGFAELIK